MWFGTKLRDKALTLQANPTEVKVDAQHLGHFLFETPPFCKKV